MSVFFNGRIWTTPATMSVVDDSAMYNKNLTVGNVLAIIGKSAGGEPAKALTFGSAAAAKAVLRDGEGLRAVERAFDPSAQVPGPSKVVFIRVNPATRSSHDLLDAGATAVIGLQSEGYGAFTNGIKVKVEAASVKGKKLTTQFGLDYFSSDNVYRDALGIHYTGAGAAATVTIGATTLTLVVDAVTVATIALADTPTIQDLADRINATAGFVASVKDGNGAKVALNGLDFATTADCKTAEYVVTANLQAIIDWFNGVGEGFVTATRKANVGVVPANVGFTYLSGGSDGVVTNAEWQAAFDALKTADVQWVVPISPSAAIHAMADAHVAFMSNVGRMERRAIVGTDVGTTDSVALDAAKALNSDRTSLCHLGFYDYNPAGALTLYPPYILAAMVAGAFSGVNPGTPLTNKTLKVRGLERKLQNPVDTDALIDGGVLCVEDTPKGFKVVKSITTWLTNDNYNRVEVSTGVAADFVSRNVRDILDDLRGKKGSPALLAEAVSRAESTLLKLAEPEPMGPAVIVGDAQNPPFKNITASLEGDVMKVEFQCSPVIPCNYIPIVVHAVPYSGSASA